MSLKRLKTFAENLIKPSNLIHMKKGGTKRADEGYGGNP
jgi:hypothetical protein